MHCPKRNHSLWVSSLLLLSAIAPVSAAGDISTWQCLPEETAIAVRIPNGKALVDACIANTKLGAVLFSEKRREILAGALAKSNSDEWAEFQQKLSEYGLTTEELLRFFAGESGYAVVVAQDSEGTPRALGLSWLQPGEELAKKAFDVLARAIEEQEDQENAIVRVDLELANRPVMQLMLPHVTTEHEGTVETPEGYDQMSVEEQEAAWEDAYEQWEASAVQKTRYGAVLLATLGDRVLLAHSFRQDESQEAHPDVPALEEVFTRLLTAHESGEGGFVGKYADDAGVGQVLGLEGVGAFEALGDVAALLPLLRADADNQEMAEKVVRILGLDCMGPFVIRSTLDDTRWHSQFALALSQPRRGLVQWVDQPPIDAEPPAWVPANAITYSQMSFDLGKAYAVLKEEIGREFPDQAGQYFSMAEMQVVGFAQVGVEELLSSLGTKHVALNFEAALDAAASLEEQQPESTAVVWQVTDPQLWTRVMQAITPLVSSMPGAEVTDEQGYNGIRFKNDAIEGGLLLGNGNLVLAYGPQVLETMLSSLNSPPEGAGAFRASEVYRQAAELVQADPSLAYKVVDGNRYGAILRTWILEFLKTQQENVDPEDEDSADDAYWAGVMTELMPTEEEMKGMLGVIVSRWEVNDHGIFSSSVQDTPAP